MHRSSGMGFIRHYVSLILFAAGLLAGVQVPNFVDQYQKRVDAHYREAAANLSGFQHIADLYHHGSVEELIRRHDTSRDPSFRSEAQPIRSLYRRKLRYQTELQALDTAFLPRVAHVLLNGDYTMLRETYDHYTADVPLSGEAALCALTAAVALCAAFELLIGLVRVVVVMNVRARRAAQGV